MPSRLHMNGPLAAGASLCSLARAVSKPLLSEYHEPMIYSGLGQVRS